MNALDKIRDTKCIEFLSTMKWTYHLDKHIQEIYRAGFEEAVMAMKTEMSKYNSFKLKALNIVDECVMVKNDLSRALEIIDGFVNCGNEEEQRENISSSFSFLNDLDSRYNGSN